MSYISQWKLLNDADFRGRVTVAALKAGFDIIAESPDTEHHGQRVTLAYQVQSRETPALDGLVLACAMNTTIAAAEANQAGSSADGDLDYVIASSWNRQAGVSS